MRDMLRLFGIAVFAGLVVGAIYTEFNKEHDQAKTLRDDEAHRLCTEQAQEDLTKIRRVVNAPDEAPAEAVKNYINVMCP